MVSLVTAVPHLQVIRYGPASRPGLVDASRLQRFTRAFRKAGTTRLAGWGEAGTVSFCLPPAPRNLSLCSVFFLGGKKRKIFIDH